MHVLDVYQGLYHKAMRGAWARPLLRVLPRKYQARRAMVAVCQLVHLASTRCAGVQVKPGARLRDIHALSVDLLTESLADLGVSTSAAAGGYRRFYPHSVGHWLGLDTHDCASIAHDQPLEEGVALTVEPGLYLKGQGVPAEFQGIGVRIEDDVVVTGDGVRVLTHEAPTSVADLETLVGSALR